MLRKPHQSPRDVAKVTEGGWLGRGGRCGRKVGTRSEKALATPIHSQVPEEQGQNTGLPPVRSAHCSLENRQAPRTWGKGGGRGCLLGFSAQGPHRPARPRTAAGHLRSPSGPPPGARPTWRPLRPLCGPRRRADAGRDSRGRGPGGRPAQGTRGAHGAGAARGEGRRGGDAAARRTRAARAAAPPPQWEDKGSPRPAVPRTQTTHALASDSWQP